MTLDYLGAVRRDSKVVDAIRRQQPLLALYPKANAAADVSVLAQRLIQRQRGAPPAAANIR
jgi:MinD-like ATPase involved in chromosome partitioning or flagellar assembly